MLKVYPTVILQLTTIGLLLSFSASAASLMPAMLPQTAPAVEEREVRMEDYQPISDPKNVEKYINDYFADIPLMTHIAKCESRYRQLDANGQVLRGMKNRQDIGVMQINEQYHAEKAVKLGLDIYSLEGNTAYARYLYEKEGAKPWMSSSACWAKFSESEIARR